MSDRYFYKVYLNDIDNIIKTDTNINLVEFLKQLIDLKHSNSVYLTPDNENIWLSCRVGPTLDVIDYGWMMNKNTNRSDLELYDFGYDYYIDADYEYKGEYLSIIRQRKIKLSRLENKL